LSVRLHSFRTEFLNFPIKKAARL